MEAEINLPELFLFLLDSFDETRRVQLTFQQISEIALHKDFRFLLDLEAGPRTRGIAVARALEVTQVFEHLH